MRLGPSMLTGALRRWVALNPWFALAIISGLIVSGLLLQLSMTINHDVGWLL